MFGVLHAGNPYTLPFSGRFMLYRKVLAARPHGPKRGGRFRAQGCVLVQDWLKKIPDSRKQQESRCHEQCYFKPRALWLVM